LDTALVLRTGHHDNFIGPPPGESNFSRHDRSRANGVIQRAFSWTQGQVSSKSWRAKISPAAKTIIISLTNDGQGGAAYPYLWAGFEVDKRNETL